MPISHKHKAILVHIPKTGGTSIEAALEMHGTVSDIGIVPYKRQRRDYRHLFCAGMQHYTISEIRDCLALSRFSDYSKFGSAKHLLDRFVRIFDQSSDTKGRQIFDAYFKFGVVRNPYSRLVSGFAWRDGNWHKSVQPGKTDFTKYVESIRSRSLFKKDVHLMPQHEFLELDGTIGVDQVLRLENLGDDFRELCNHLNVSLELPKRMVSKHKDAVEYYDDHSRSIVFEIYKKDFELFGYAP